MFSPQPRTMVMQTPSQGARGATPVTAQIATIFCGLRVAEALKLGDPHLCNLEVPATLFQQFHPGRVLDSLVNRLSGLVQTRRPVEERARVIRIEKSERLSLELGTLLLPQIDAKRALRR
jgi:hypothetical protein